MLHGRRRLHGTETLLSRLFHAFAARQGVLLRDYIHGQLYSKGGYFQQAAPPVAHLPSAIDFRSLLGRIEYLRAVDAAYKSLQVAWLTPSEIFTPHYGNAVAAHLLELQKPRSSPMRIYEIGAGSGTLALDILNHIRERDGSEYAECLYTSCEISAPLAEMQRQRVSDSGGHGARFRAIQMDASTASGWRLTERPGSHAFIIAMEVLDNCGHDRVSHKNGEWLQEDIEGDVEFLRAANVPLTDTLAKEILAMHLAAAQNRKSRWQRLLNFLAGVSTSEGSGNTIFLPTKAAELLSAVCQSHPSHDLVVADFHALPDVSISGQNAPLVARTGGGETSDLASYLGARGKADIFFPTDFELLCRIYEATGVRQGAIFTLSRGKRYARSHHGSAKDPRGSEYNLQIAYALPTLMQQTVGAYLDCR